MLGYPELGHPVNIRASVQSWVVVNFNGMTSGQQVYLSMMVNRYEKRSQGGERPTRSTWIWENTSFTNGMTCTGEWWWN